MKNYFQKVLPRTFYSGMYEHFFHDDNPGSIEKTCWIAEFKSDLRLKALGLGISKKPLNSIKVM